MNSLRAGPRRNFDLWVPKLKRHGGTKACMVGASGTPWVTQSSPFHAFLVIWGLSSNSLPGTPQNVLVFLTARLRH